MLLFAVPVVSLAQLSEARSGIVDNDVEIILPNGKMLTARSNPGQVSANGKAPVSRPTWDVGVGRWYAGFVGYEGEAIEWLQAQLREWADAQPELIR